MVCVNVNVNVIAGENSFVWFGPKPAVIIMDPEIVREVMTKSYTYQKIPGNRLSKLLAQGVATYETDKWAKHRRLMNPAFYMEKLKVLSSKSNLFFFPLFLFFVFNFVGLM